MKLQLVAWTQSDNELYPILLYEAHCTVNYYEVVNNIRKCQSNYKKSKYYPKSHWVLDKSIAHIAPQLK